MMTGKLNAGRIRIVRAEDSKQELQKIMNRSRIADQSKETDIVKRIISDVQKNRDAALFEYTKKFDGFELNAQNIRVTREEIAQAYAEIDAALLETIKVCKQNIFEFHQKQKQNTWLNIQDEFMVGQMIRPLSSVGLYVPGGRASYPSTVLMNALPAKVAGVDRIIMVTPPNRSGKINALTLVAAHEAGVDQIYKIGGAQAVAALAFGTASIPAVDKITGPGNIYVALAKREVFGYVGIDMIAGPSEVLIIADDSANADYIAADLLSQAEHDPMAAAILITTSPKLAEKVASSLEQQLEVLPKRNIAAESIRDYGAIIVVNGLDKAIDIANTIAPEHLEILTENPINLLGKIKNAGAIFLGEYSPEPLGDYFAGPNHTLPTSTTSRFFSPLSVDDFVKKSSIIHYSKEALEGAAPHIIRFAKAEGLEAHARSIEIRQNQ